MCEGALDILGPTPPLCNASVREGMKKTVAQLKRYKHTSTVTHIVSRAAAGA
jgi:hypothetical protein